MKKHKQKKANRLTRQSERDTMRPEYDFSKAVRGKFFRAGAELDVPIYLEPQVAKAVQAQARKKRTTMGSVVNEVLRKNLRAKRNGRSAKTR